MRYVIVYLARHRRSAVATLTLIDTKYFSASRRPLYLTSMAADPGQQRKGVGRLCIEEGRRLARQWPSDAIELDAFDAGEGAGDFYRKCGFKEVGRAPYRTSSINLF